LAAHPKIALAFGWTHVFLSRYDELAAYLHRLRSLLADGTITAEINSELTALEAEVSLHHGNIDAVLRQLDPIDFATFSNRWLQAMLRQIHGYALRIDGAVVAAIDALTTARQLTDLEDNYPLWLYATDDLAEASMIQGNLYAAEALYQEIFTSLPPEQHSAYPGLDFAFVGYGSLLFKRNQLNEALDQVQRGIALSRIAGQDVSVTHHGLSVLARIRQAQGAWDDARQIVTQVEATGKRQRSKRVTVQANLLKAHLYLLEGQVEPVNLWAATATTDRPPFIPRLVHHAIQRVYARWLFHHDPASALDHLSELQTQAEANEWQESLLEITILQAAAYHRQNQKRAATDKLQKAFELARPGGYVRFFVELASDLAPLLRSLSREGKADPFVGRIQAAFLPADSTAQPLIDPLSARELEILQLVADGLSNPEIAQRLIIATGTVARHTSNIFGKLAVRNRTEATVRARQLGLI
jgi:LuxR family maltose regulon positive regulatory protein